MGKRKLILAGVLTLVLIAGGVAIGREFIGEADGVVEQSNSQPTPAATVEQRVTVKGRYAQFSYPTKFITLPAEKPVAPIVEHYNFRKQQVSAWQVSITVTKLATGRLDDDASYSYRDETPARFERSEQVIGGNKVIIFTDRTSDVFSRVAFLQNGNYDAGIAITGGTSANMEQIEADFAALIGSWQWL